MNIFHGQTYVSIMIRSQLKWILFSSPLWTWTSKKEWTEHQIVKISFKENRVIGKWLFFLDVSRDSLFKCRLRWSTRENFLFIYRNSFIDSLWGSDIFEDVTVWRGVRYTMIHVHLAIAGDHPSRWMLNEWNVAKRKARISNWKFEF